MNREVVYLSSCLELSRDTDVMRCFSSYCDITEVIFAYIVAMVTGLMGGRLGGTLSQQLDPEISTTTLTSRMLTSYPPPEEEVCCNGVLGYATDNLSLNYPCQTQPCCNRSDIITVISIDFAMGFQFQCMARKLVHTLCYEIGAEVRTTNQDPDFIPRTCCQGLKFKVLLNQWYAAMVVKCVGEDENENNS